MIRAARITAGTAAVAILAAVGTLWLADRLGVWMVLH